MDILIDIMLPVFGVVTVGAVARWFGWIEDRAVDAVASFVFTFAVPALLLRTVGTTDLPEQPPIGLFASFYIGAIAIYLGGMVIGRFGFARPAMGQTLTGMACAFGNTVMVGFPIMLAAYGDEKALPFFLILSIHGLIFFTLTTLLLEVQNGVGGRDGLRALPLNLGKALVTNPILIGIALGLTANLSGLGVPDPIERVCAVLQGAVAPCALFVLGASLVRYGIRGRVAQAAVVSVMKLMIFPAITYVLATYVFQIDPHWAEVATITAALPVGIMAFVFSSKYGTGQAISATSVSLSTVASLFTLWGLLVLFQAT
jgi:predicted permease